jgi:hypothetical protein
VIQAFYKFRYLYTFNEKEHYYNLLYQFDEVHLGHKQTTQQSKYPILELMKKPGILIVLMGHKIISWYFNNKKAKMNASITQERVEVAPPIEESQVEDEGKCPICTKSIKNATMVRSSGYVYCFDCINDYARKEQRCPMSRLPITA